jgi:hypothetical protein
MGGRYGPRLTRKFLYSRFRPVRTFRDEGDTMTCCTFLGDGCVPMPSCNPFLLSEEIPVF